MNTDVRSVVRHAPPANIRALSSYLHTVSQLPSQDKVSAVLTAISSKDIDLSDPDDQHTAIATLFAANFGQVSPAEEAEQWQAWAQAHDPTAAPLYRYEKTMEAIRQLDEVAAQGHPAFTQGHADQRKFKLVAFASQFWAPGVETLSGFNEGSDESTVEAEFPKVLDWVRTCKNTAQVQYLPTLAAYPLIKDLLSGQDHQDYDAFLYAMDVAQDAPQIDEREFAALTVWLERALANPPEDASDLPKAFEWLCAIAALGNPQSKSLQASLRRLEGLAPRISPECVAQIGAVPTDALGQGTPPRQVVRRASI